VRSKEFSIELRDRIVSRHRYREGYQKIYAALKVPKNTLAAVILKWKKFGTTKTLPRAGHPAEKGHGQGGDQEPDGHLDRAPEFQKPLLSKRHKTASLEFSKRHLKDSQTMRNNILWFDETKIELFGLNAKRHIWMKPGTIPTVKHGCGRITQWGCFSVAGFERLVRIDGKMNGAKYREILDKNLLQSAQCPLS
jgi:hypothetical protein